MFELDTSHTSPHQGDRSWTVLSQKSIQKLELTDGVTMTATTTA